MEAVIILEPDLPGGERPAPDYADYVLDALQAWRGEGLRTALLTLVGVEGGSPRPLGSQMAVAEDGRALGAISGGCLEQALILEAIQAMWQGEDRTVLYGRGSRYIDLRLPCGASLYVRFDVSLADAELRRLTQARADRTPADYRTPGPKGLFRKTYTPAPRVVILGQGHIAPALAGLLVGMEFEAIVCSGEAITRERAKAAGARITHLRTALDWDADVLDPWTAFVTLFHDHGDEMEMFDRALRSPSFYLGALGSRRVHADRLTLLAARGWTPQALRRIRGPVGLDLGARTPPEIALAICAEIIETYRKRDTPITAIPIRPPSPPLAST